MKQQVVKPVCLSSNNSLLTDHCTGAFWDEIMRAALLIVVLGVTAVLATGCSSTDNGFSARILSPIATNQQASGPEGIDWSDSTWPRHDGAR